MSAVMTSEIDNFPSVKQVAAICSSMRRRSMRWSARAGFRRPRSQASGCSRELIDRWMMDSAHGGLLADRLVIAGSDDPLYIAS